MKTYYIDGKEVSALEKAEHKLKQLNEASGLLEELVDRLAWADDFACYQSIREALDPAYTAVDHAKEEIDDALQELECQLDEFKEKKLEAVIEVEQDFAKEIQYSLE